MKLLYAILLGLGLKGVKIVRKDVKVCMHVCLSNGHPNIRSNFNSKKLVKSETLSCGFARIGIKGRVNSSKCHESQRELLSIKHESKSMIKFQIKEIGQNLNSIMRFH